MNSLDYAIGMVAGVIISFAVILANEDSTSSQKHQYKTVTQERIAEMKKGELLVLPQSSSLSEKARLWWAISVNKEEGFTRFTNGSARVLLSFKEIAEMDAWLISLEEGDHRQVIDCIENGRPTSESS